MNPDASVPTRPLLRRRADDQILLGVCAGIARSFELRPLVVRSAAVLAGALAFPLLVIAYTALALIMPRDDGRVLLGGRPDDGREQVLGWSFVLFAGLLLIVSRLQPEELVWPALDSSALPFAGIAIVWLTLRDRKHAAPDVSGASAPGAPPAPAAPASAAPTPPAPMTPPPAAPAAAPAPTPPPASTPTSGDVVDGTATTVVHDVPAVPSQRGPGRFLARLRRGD
ncbi:PspC domain-containing protein [Conexibacter sp. JD483]|uniref:PspC domain-containing protein n=1 Tax=unclassified Conexibacter TaxID=2627773 RepID=UPI002725EC5C|nr:MULTISPECIES: PspC domain-containing protein [unclassified Conexibacter]MDO8185204.1 PspC domain-containing protein [Conexibacter sp. CPCC 205706]MDO8198250.1 PspC domain-containing protein [Conexibacter sp. CPCC 205762]MDR9367788.1 PspC domain-containing protein [Conexibacter sp. JD483]